MTTPSAEPAAPDYGGRTSRTYRFWMPRFWHGMRLSSWARLLWQNRFAVSPGRLPMAASITTVSALNSIGGMLEEIFLGHVSRQTRLAAPPLFVLGHWRSGTTLLHELLILDPAHTYPTTYECFSPLNFLITERWVTPWTGWALPSRRPMDNMETGWQRPQEDEFALCNLGVPSPYLVWAFPNHGPVNTDYLTLANLSDDERRRWQTALERFVQRVATARNRRVVLKSPPHTARVRALLEIYPDARFVHITRDPLVLFPSTVRLWKSLSEVSGLHPATNEDQWLEESVLGTLETMYEQFEQDRALVPEGHLVDVRYEDLVADPIARMREIYAQLELGDFDRALPAMTRYLDAQRDYRTNRYSLPEDVEAKVRTRWAGYFERYGY